MAPDWLGSPQHLAAGVALSLAGGIVARRRLGWSRLWSFAAAVTVTMAAEALLELLEYPLEHAGHVHRTAYYDTVADIGLTLAGALIGGLVAIVVVRFRRPPGRAG
ncbi:MAG TPA: hypothetical protein VGF63_03310 [Solirubrobacteraceae bacterium]